MDARLVIDTIVLFACFFGIVALGLWAGRRNKNLQDFSLGSRSIPWWAVLASTVGKSLGGLDHVKLFQSDWNSSLPFGRALKPMLEEPYTLFAAFIGSTMITMATHGTDQDMAQRMCSCSLRETGIISSKAAFTK